MRTKTKNRASIAAATAALAVASLAGKVLGAVYRIPLTNMLGAEGMGLYQTFFPVYALFVTLTSGAIPAVVGRYVATARASGKDASDVFFAARRLCFVLAAAGVTAFAAAAFPIAALQGVGANAAGYAILVPAVGAVALSSLYRGWNIADGGVGVCALTQTAEQAVKLLFGLALAYFASRKGVVWAVYGALAAVTISEFAGLAILRTDFAKRRRIFPARVDKKLCKNMFATMLPMLASALVLPLVTFVDSFAIVRLVGAYGLDAATARCQYGLLTGAVGTLVNLPVVVALSVAIAILPKVTAEFVSGGKSAAHAKTSSTAAYGLMFALPCTIAFALFPQELLAALYPALGSAELALAAKLLRAQAFNVTLIALMQILSSSLQAMGRGRSVMIYMIVGGAIRLALQAVLIPRIGVIGAPLAQCAMFALVVLLQALAYREETGASFIGRNMFAKTVLSGVIMVIAETALTAVALCPWAKLAAAVAVGIVSYVGTLFATGAISLGSLRRENIADVGGQKGE